MVSYQQKVGQGNISNLILRAQSAHYTALIDGVNIHAPDDPHWKDHIRVFPTLKQVAQNIIGNAPDKINNFVVCVA